MQIDEILEQVIMLCRRYSVETVILFGSRAKGTALERSDIDIAVAGGRDIDALREEVEEIPTLYKIDLVDLDTCGNELLKEDIAVYGRKIYEKI